MKKHILSILSFMVILSFTACASDETTQGETQESISEGVTSFVMDDDNEITRTTGEYDGSGINFYWTEGDRLWINTGTAASPILKQDNNNSINRMLKASTVTGGVDRTATAKFYFNGTYTAASYPVRYTGRNSTVGDKVTIKAQQTQSVPNDASHIGESGDCGTATAVESGGQYKFNLDHKAAYVTFIPYNSQGAIPGAKITKIKVTADSPIAGTYDFDDNGLNTISPSSTSNTIELTLGRGRREDFSIPDVITPGTNAIIMVIAPGTYNNFTVEYTLYDLTTNVTGTITKTYSNVTFIAGKNKRISQDLQITVYPGNEYYMWDAQQHYWADYEWDGPNPQQPTTNGGGNYNYPFSSTDSRWYNNVKFGIAASQSARDCPNINEAMWYISHGDPHWDNNTLWVTMGHLYKGGIWFKRKSQISGYSTTQGPEGMDHTVSYVTFFYHVTPIQGKPDESDLNNYFYLPALGFYFDGVLNGIGSVGFYWLSTSEGNITGYCLQLAPLSLVLPAGGFFKANGFRLWTAQ